jgi:predicted PurR-regulated permease PerM
MPSGKGFWRRVAERYGAETSSECFRRRRRTARIQGGLIFIFGVVTAGVFWLMKWPPGVGGAVLVGGSVLIMSLGPRPTK